MSQPNWKNRTLFHGDNLDFLRAMNSESVDLIATDPPFNKGRDFHATPDSLAKGAKFQDRWSWKRDVHEEWVDQIKDDHPRVMNVVQGSRSSYGDDMGAFLCFMAVRLLAMHRVLKPTGSIYLHCDPTASHYLKELMDAVFGRKNFRNEVIWHYRRWTGKAKLFQKLHDIVLFYSKSDDYTFHILYTDYTEGSKDRKKQGVLNRFKDGEVHRVSYKSIDKKGVRENDVWQIPFIPPSAKERIGYPTQKPIRLYERMIKASSNEGDMVLDPFAGCATTCVAAERLKRQWVGIDIWDKARDVVIERLQKEGLAAPDGGTGGIALPLHGKIHYFREPPERTDSGETATVALETIRRSELAAWQKLSHKEMVAILEQAQADADNAKLVVCAGCGRKLEPEFMELDHLMPKSEPRSANDLSNRILLCRPCNGRKSNRLTMNGLWRENKNKEVGWMVDEKLAKNALALTSNAVLREQRKD